MISWIFPLSNSITLYFFLNSKIKYLLAENRCMCQYWWHSNETKWFCYFTLDHERHTRFFIRISNCMSKSFPNFPWVFVLLWYLQNAFIAIFTLRPSERCCIIMHSENDQKLGQSTSRFCSFLQLENHEKCRCFFFFRRAWKFATKILKFNQVRKYSLSLDLILLRHLKFEKN